MSSLSPPNFLAPTPPPSSSSPIDHGVLFHLRALDSPLLLVTPDLNLPSSNVPPASDDPFHPTGFITAFSTSSHERVTLYARSTTSFSGHLAELERLLDSSSSSCTDSSGPMVSMDNLRAYLQIVDVASILRLDQFLEVLAPAVTIQR